MSFYGTILNNYPESYEPNLGKIQQIEEAFGDINKKIETNTKDITDHTNDITKIQNDIQGINNEVSNTINNLLDMDNTIGGHRIYIQNAELRKGNGTTEWIVNCGSDEANNSLHGTKFSRHERVILLSAETYCQNGQDVIHVDLQRSSAASPDGSYNYKFYCSSKEALNNSYVNVFFYYIIYDIENRTPY